jgi:hypothetical protein
MYTVRKTYSETDLHSDKQAGDSQETVMRQADLQSYKTNKLQYIQIDKRTGRQTNLEMDRQGNMQFNTHMEKQNKMVLTLKYRMR